MDSFAQKASHLKSLDRLAIVDGVYSKSEAVYIEKVAEKLGVDLDKIDLTSHSKLVLPDKEYKLYCFTPQVSHNHNGDNEVTDNEKSYCIKLGIKMGLHRNAVTDVVAYVAREGEVFHSTMEVMDIFKKYMN